MLKHFLFVAASLLLSAAPGLAQSPPPPPPASRPDSAPGQSQLPLTLDQAVQEAIEHNLDILARRYDLNIAEARIITAGMHPNPTLSVGGDHLDLLGTGYNAINAAGPPEYSLRSDWTLEGGGKRGLRIEVAELSKEVTKLQLQDATRLLIFEVEKAFVEVILAQGNLALAQENRTAFGRIVRVSTDRVRFGDLARVELMRTKLAELQYDNAVILARARLRTAKQGLLLLMGRSAQEAEFEVQSNLARPPVPQDVSELENQALGQRPDYLALLRDQSRAEAAVRLEEAKGKLDYIVGAEYRRQQGLAGRGNSLGVFLALPLPVFDTNEGEIERARQEFRQVEALGKALQATIRKEIATALEQLTAAEKTVRQIETSMLTQARQVLDTMEYSYRAGHASLVELLDAQRAYNDIVLSYNEALAEFSRSRFLLESTIARQGGQP